MRLSHIIPIVLAAAQVEAWGQLGHRTVALLATRFLLPETSTFIKEVLQGEGIARAAVWPDYFGHTPAGRYSKAWHYIDARDDPPHHCGVQFDRDCAGLEGCVVAAIANMTDQLVVGKHLVDKKELVLPMRFLLHFIGDVHQPLHTENLDRGGNSIHVLFHNRQSNLHSVWDSLIPEKHVGGKTFRHAVQWTNDLHAMLADVGGKFNTVRNTWGSGCFPVEEGEIVDGDLAMKCALAWANEVNQYVCSHVFDKEPKEMTGRELGDEYYENARHVVEELVARAAWRLAIFLNLIVTGRTGIDEQTSTDGLVMQGGETLAEKVMLKFVLH